MGLFGFGKKKKVERDPVCGTDVDAASTPFRSVHDGEVYHFCSANCMGTFRADPAKYAR